MTGNNYYTGLSKSTKIIYIQKYLSTILHNKMEITGIEPVT